ncbi:hypothetical protein MSAN_00417200 [Mycena sanguinolenta]|uniref:RNase III domain-containing protein n=1 Tax=Mycena sanguinolenta TaxID=230812 RepID=A0A8H6ZDH5_9AGAR|nr:hypothetical protein MSAN_00417200 [Mycena sanguinolenta]
MPVGSLSFSEIHHNAIASLDHLHVAVFFRSPRYNSMSASSKPLPFKHYIDILLTFFLFSHMHRQQRKLLALIEAPTYRISLPPCTGMRDFLFSSGDPEFLDALETYGDSRLAFCVARFQRDRFPWISQAEHRKSRDFLLSNRTLQSLAVKMRVYFSKIFSKGVANAIEIFVEALAEMEGEDAAHDWIVQTFSPLIEGLVSRSSKHRSQSPKPVVARPGKKRQGKAEPARYGKRMSEFPELFDWTAALPLPSSAVAAIQAMSNTEIDICANMGCIAWRHHTYAVIKAEAGFLPSSVLTDWRKTVADNKQRLQTVADLLGVPAVFGGRLEEGKVALGAFLMAFLPNHSRAEVAAARQWLSRLLAPGLRIARARNDPQLETFPRKRNRDIYEYSRTITVLERLADRTDHAHVLRATLAASEHSLVSDSAPATRKRVASEQDEPSSPSRKRLRHESPPRSEASRPSRIPLATLSTNYQTYSVNVDNL